MKVIAVCLGCFLLCFSLCTCGVSSVETEDQAVAIAKTAVAETFDKDFSACYIRAERMEDIWVVTYCDAVSTEVVLGGGYPVIRIAAENGKILSCLLSK